MSTCITCTKISSKEYREKNKQKIYELNKKYRKENPEKVKKWAKKARSLEDPKWKDYRKKYRFENKDKLNAKARDHYNKNLEYHRKRAKKYRNKDLRRSYEKNKYQTDTNYRLARVCRARIVIALKTRFLVKDKKTEKLIGCSIPFLMSYLETMFKPSMSWDNYGKGGWHIDHIKPCASFDLSNEVQLEQCFHYSNLQPLWEFDNLSKGKK